MLMAFAQDVTELHAAGLARVACALRLKTGLNLQVKGGFEARLKGRDPNQTTSDCHKTWCAGFRGVVIPIMGTFSAISEYHMLCASGVKLVQDTPMMHSCRLHATLLMFPVQDRTRGRTERTRTGGRLGHDESGHAAREPPTCEVAG
jgi:hypothetical protein